MIYYVSSALRLNEVSEPVTVTKIYGWDLYKIFISDKHPY